MKHNNYENIKTMEGQKRQLQIFPIPSLFFTKVSITIVESVTESSRNTLYSVYKGKLLTSFFTIKRLYFCLNKLHWGRVNLASQVCDLKSEIVS